ncbi:PGRS family protein [Sorangium sp. So ce296]|uniref:PGRS family protein n=1 Tax=Sorangium sp. So ce296 TaxID=3133296 RepID=UPI003F62F941
MGYRKQSSSARTPTSTFGMVGFTVALLGGCDGVWSDRANDCKLTLMCEEYGGLWDRDASVAGCVPSEEANAVEDRCGVFVAASGDDARAGTKEEPVKTLSEAIARAADKGGGVYACAEKFAEAIDVPAGVMIFGGLDCANGWRWIGEEKKTIVAPGVEAIPLTLARGEGTTRIEDVEAVAPDAQAKGGSSIAVLAYGSTAELERCALVAGNAADGADGDNAPSEAPERAPSGSNGVDACSDLDGTEGPDATLSGGAQVVNECGVELSIGGSGGDGNINNGAGGVAGQTGVEGQAGAGEPPSMNESWSCGAIPNDPTKGGGSAGANGSSGPAGAGASGLGTLSATGYIGVPGEDGTPGKPGQGGGGGGGAKGGLVCAGGISGAGASGGSGGAGGCGGLPGLGGRPGGASIALASVDANVTLIDCTLTAGHGGNGGKGGNLQPGASGGLGGQGGVGFGGSSDGCAGGQGGKGGNGGPGGGGLGGPSIAIAFRGGSVKQEGKTTLAPSAPGKGGLGGSNNAAMNAGADGVAAAEQELP